MRFLLPLVGLLATVCPAVAQAQDPIRPEEGRPQVPWQEARSLVGQAAAIYGKVIDVRQVGHITFINFDSQRPARFAGVIFQDRLRNFPVRPEQSYPGKIVRIVGTVSTYKDQPQIVVSRPEQVEVLEAMPQPMRPAAVASREPRPGQLVVGTYNLLNLFDGYDDPYHDDEGTPPKPRIELERLAASIRALNADVLAVEEVENRGYLERFVSVFLPDMGYRHVVLIEGNDTRGIDIGLLSRVPVGKATSHRHVAFAGADGSLRRFNRDLLAVTLQPADARSIEMWVLHLKSNAGGREEAEPIRLAEAQAVRQMLDEELGANPEARIIVAGDFNDTPDSVSTTTIIGQESGVLWSAGSDLNDPSAVTYNKGEFRSVIDFILCSRAMASQYVAGSCRVPQGSVETTGSDHNPIVATFRTN